MDLKLENRKVLSLTGIKKVKTTEPTCVVAVLDETMIIITGQNMSVEGLSIKDGTLEIHGLVDSIKYTKSQARKFSIRNMFR